MICFFMFVLLLALIFYQEIAEFIIEIFREETQEELDQFEKDAEWRLDFEERWKKSQENTKDRNI